MLIAMNWKLSVFVLTNYLIADFLVNQILWKVDTYIVAWDIKINALEHISMSN